MLGAVTEVSRFASRDQFAACNGTAPIEVSSGSRKIHRLSRRGSRRLNHAIHMAAVTQIRYRDTPGRACYDREIAEGKTPKKHSARSSDGSATPSSPACRPTPATRRQPPLRAREGNRGNDSAASAAGSHPEHRLFGQATPEPATTLRLRRDAQSGKTSARVHGKITGAP